MRKIVLVVENNNELLEDISILLQFSDFLIINADSYKIALGMLYSHKPDIVVVDMNIPSIDGIELLKKAKNDPDLKDIPFILISSDKTKTGLIQRNSKTCLLIKPFKTEELLDNIIILIESKVKNLSLIEPY